MGMILILPGRLGDEMHSEGCLLIGNHMDER